MKDLEFLTGLDDVGVARFAQDEDPPVVPPRGSGEATSDLEALAAIDLPTCPGVVRDEETSVQKRVVVPLIDQGRRVVGPQQRVGPCDVFR